MPIAVLAYAANNVGDDLFISMLTKRYPHQEFHFVSSNPADLQIVDTLPNAQVIDPRTLLTSLPGYRALIILGGSMFQQGPQWHLQWLGYMRRAIRARMAGVPVVVMGASFGPTRLLRFRAAYRAFFSLCTWISFRDQSSLRSALSPRNAHWWPDLVFAQGPYGTEEPASADIPRPYVGVSVMAHTATSGDPMEIRAGMRAMISELSRSGDVRLFSFQESSIVSDGNEIAALMQGLAPEVLARTEVVRYDPMDIRGFLSKFSECERIVSCRFHAMILALCFGQPQMVLGYHAKIFDTLRTLKVDLPVYAPSEYHRAWQDIPYYLPSQTAPASIEQYRRDASMHFAFLDRLLVSRH